MKKKKAVDSKETGLMHLEIPAPNMKMAVFRIIGTAPLVMNRFSEKAKGEIKDKQEMGQKAKKMTKHDPKDFDDLYNKAFHFAKNGGWVGIPASAFRCALISACRTVGFKMTLAKLSIQVKPDGFDTDGTPLVKILKGKPEKLELIVRLPNGNPDVRIRPMWDPGWEADVKIEYDADQFSATDVANLLARVGRQVGILEGRPDSKNSPGMGWGLFNLSDASH